MATLEQILQAATEEELEQLWSTFFLNVEAARAALARPVDELTSLLAKGAEVTKSPWTNTRIAVKLEALCGVPYVATTFKAYNEAFLYSLALAAQVDLNVALTEKQAEVSFALARQWRQGGAGGPRRAAVTDERMSGAEEDAHATDREDEEEEEDVEPLEWEDQRQQLPGDLEKVLARQQSGSLQVDLRQLFESLPKFYGLADKAPQNNYRQDSGSKVDKVLRSAQQKVLNLQRLYACLHTGLSAENAALGQQFFFLLFDMEHWAEQERKKHSLPGSIGPGEPVIFSGEDLKLNAEVSKINAAGSPFRWNGSGGTFLSSQHQKLSVPQQGFSPSAGPSSSSTWCLLPPTGKGFKYKSFKGSWKGRGKGTLGRGYKGGSYRSGYKGGKGPAICTGAAAIRVTVPSKKLQSRATVPMAWKQGAPSACVKSGHSANGFKDDNVSCRDSAVPQRSSLFRLGFATPPVAALDSGGRSQVGWNTPPPKTSRELVVVEKERPPQSGVPDKGGYLTPVAHPPHLCPKWVVKVKTWHRPRKFCSITKKVVQ